MSIDSSLKIKGALSRHRNVLTRAERVAQLQAEERWSEDDDATGLPKIAHRKIHTARKEAKAPEEEGVEGVEGAEGTEAAPEAEK
jgi:small basic protein (TIGR04137 family)